MRIEQELIDDLLLNNTIDNLDYVSEWVGDKVKSVKTFAVTIDNKLYQGEIVREFTHQEGKKDSDGKEITKGKTTVKYSHETDSGVEVYEVKKVYVRKRGQLTVEYRRV